MVPLYPVAVQGKQELSRPDANEYSRVPLSDEEEGSIDEGLLSNRSKGDTNIGSGSSDEEVNSHSYTPLDDEDTYSHVMVSIILDSHRISVGTEYLCAHVGRLCFSIGLVVVTISLQMAVVFEARRLLSARAVHEIREVYSDFENKMYNGSAVVDGQYRGISGFSADQFKTVSEDEKEVVCQIPLAHPHYLMLVLLIWALTTLSEVRRCCTVGLRAIINTPLTHSMHIEKTPDDPLVFVVKGVTLPVKMAVTFVLVPRTVMACALLWLGSRWLLATPDLTELLLNAMALEFVLLLKDLLYQVVVPHRNKVDVQQTLFEPITRKERITCFNISGTLVILVLAVGWAVLYPFAFQRVLRGYKFDVAAVCEQWLAEKTSI